MNENIYNDVWQPGVMAYAESESPDKPAQVHSLTSVFAGHWRNHWIRQIIYTSTEQATMWDNVSYNVCPASTQPVHGQSLCCLSEEAFDLW